MGCVSERKHVVYLTEKQLKTITVALRYDTSESADEWAELYDYLCATENRIHREGQ